MNDHLLVFELNGFHPEKERRDHEDREASGLSAGDQVEVTLELDLEPRTVEIPVDLRTALSALEGATQAFEALAFSSRKELVRQVEDAKTQETRDRRISGIVAKLSGS